MERYTESAHSNVERQINHIMGEIVNEIVSCVHPKSIILTGGFGRGEVAVIDEEEVRFLSDCEINIVPDKYISRRSIKKIKDNLTKKTELELFINKGIAVKIYSLLPVPRIISRKIWKPTIQRYDYKYGSRIIYGDNCLEKTPDFKPEDIPLWEGVRLLFNRMVETLKYFSVDNSCMLEEKQELIYWISKIIIACQDALLLSVGKYHPSYRIRNNEFRELFPQFFNGLNKELPNFLPLTLKATNYKLNPEKDIYKESTTELWFATVEICDSVFRYVIEKDMGITFDTYLEFQDNYLKHPNIKNKYYNELLSSSIYQNMMIMAKVCSSYGLFQPKIISKIRIPWKHIVYSLIPLIYFSLSRNGDIDSTQLKEARNTLLLFKKLKSPNQNLFEEWEYIKKEVFDLWYAICH